MDSLALKLGTGPQELPLTTLQSLGADVPPLGGALVPESGRTAPESTTLNVSGLAAGHALVAEGGLAAVGAAIGIVRLT